MQFAFAYYNLHFVCAHTKKQTWPFLPEICYSIVSAWSWYYHYLHYLGDAIYNFQACCIIITNECHNRHVCNSSSEWIKVSFLLKEIIYDKSPIFFLPVINTFFFWPKYRLRHAYCHMTAILYFGLIKSQNHVWIVVV